MSSTSDVAVTVIPATIDLRRPGTFRSDTKRRTAAYARVSTGDEEQLTSYYAQVDYYSNYIKNKAEWEYVGMYADEGITGTSTKRRKGFNDLVADALAGKIDLIITKSVSRFARNTVDTLTTVRKLKEHGVEVYFEKENIYTFDSKGELLLTIMSSLAQEESRSISENVTWGHRKRMADGKVHIPYKRFLGYTKGEDGNPVIDEDEAETVRLIYSQYLGGYSFHEIANQLTRSDALSPGGKDAWNVNTVKSILQNEKYKGDALLQKSFTVDYLTKKTKVNEGEIPQYYVENSHPAIIDADTFDLVQEEIKRRQKTGNHPVRSNPFSGKIVCGECGGFYGSKVWHSKTQYRRTIWQCNEKYKVASEEGTANRNPSRAKCNTPHIDETAIKRVFLKTVNHLIGSRDEIVGEYEAVLLEVFNTVALDEQIRCLRDECNVVAELISRCVAGNTKIAQDQVEYEKHYNSLVDRYKETKEALDKLRDEKSAVAARGIKVQQFMDELKSLDNPNNHAISDFDETLWRTLVENVTVRLDGSLLVAFKDGSVFSA